MSHSKVFKQAWKMLWSYRALWIFGIILALTTSGGWPSTPGGDSYNRTGDWTTGAPFDIPRDEWEGFDFDWPEDTDFQELERMFETWEIPQNIVRILIWIGIGLFFLVVIATVARYVSEASLLHMVNDYAETGKRYSVGKGFRLGWSRTACFVARCTLELTRTAWTRLGGTSGGNSASESGSRHRGRCRRWPSTGPTDSAR